MSLSHSRKSSLGWFKLVAQVRSRRAYTACTNAEEYILSRNADLGIVTRSVQVALSRVTMPSPTFKGEASVTTVTGSIIPPSEARRSALELR